MIARELLTDIYQSKEVADCVSKLKPIHLQQDILQHAFLELFEKEDSFIIDLELRGKLKHYIVKVLWNTANYTHNTFSKENGREKPCGTSEYEITRFQHHDLPNDLTENDDYKHQSNSLKRKTLSNDTTEQELIERIDDVACALSQMHWYKVEMLKVYADVGTHQAISDMTGIPRSSIAKTIKNARKEVKQLL